jgi:hypothetical protein
MKKRKPNKRMLEAQARHEAWLASVGVKGRTKLKGVEHVNLRDGISENAKLTNGIAGNGAKKAANVYTGDYIMGIATMHKSNAVPITSREQAVDSATMRRS